MHKFFYILTAVTLLALPQSTQTASAQTLIFNLAGRAGSGLLPGNEFPNAASSTASGGANSILFDLGTNELTIDVEWGSGNGFTDMTGNATAMHIHGPADINSNGGVLYNLGSMTGFDASASDGGFSGTVPISAADVQTLLDGNMYLNVHTSANGGGELRANIIRAVPEPTSVAILGLLSAVAALRRRRC
jgi:hypothetical protein